MVKRVPWFFHPIFIFVFSILALASSLVLYIYWYVSASAGLQALAYRYHLDPSKFLEAKTWVVILILSILVGIILAGTLIIFIFSQKMVRLNRLQHEFINNFTHELKTPVTSLKLYLETLLKYDLPREEQLKYISYMLQDTERLSENISSILDLARIETKTYGGEFVLADLVQVVQNFLQNNRHHFHDSDIRIHTPDRQFFYPVLQPLFEMLLMNLLNNGIKYNESDRPRIDIHFAVQKNKLLIRFADNGIGVERSERKKIFRKFYQGRRTQARSLRGTGLGLYLVQNIARMHKGKVIVEAKEEEKGSVFTLILPFYPRKDQA